MLPFEDDSPIKRRRDKTFDDGENSRPILTPTKLFSPKREPLTPRKDNIMSPRPRYDQTILRTPGKENVMCSSRLGQQERSPRPSTHSTTTVPRGITKARFLSFDSPVKNCAPPKHLSTPRPNTPVMSPLRLARQDGNCLNSFSVVGQVQGSHHRA